VEELSLLEAFEHAHELVRISGELPTQDVAVLRLMLAVMYAVYQREDLEGNESKLESARDALDRWGRLWQRGSFNKDQIGSYLKRYEDRFFLIHPERPFYQVNLSNGTGYKTSKLIGELSESSNKPRLFPTRTGIEQSNICYPEAARWLLYLNSYDDTSSKPTRNPDLNQKLPSVGAGWLGKLGLIYVAGSNLFETLMMNFVLLDHNDMPFEDGQACWELDNVRSEERVEIPVPNNPLELLTLQSRRLLLSEEAGTVVGYKLLGGDFFPKENAFIEQMTIWRKDEKTSEFTPKRHDPSKALWRDYTALISKGDKDGRPGIVRWVSLLQRENLLPTTMLNFRTASIKYGDKDFFVDDVFEDNISMNAHLLTDLHHEWNNRIDEILNKTDKCVWELGNFAINLLKSAGDDDENNYRGASSNIRKRAYFVLDTSFRQWLKSIDPDHDDLEMKNNDWLDVMRKIILDIGEEYLMDADERSFVGRPITIGNNVISSMKNNAISWFESFRYKVNKIIHGE
jgi:CRISPR system Cascade subunit CasA